MEMALLGLAAALAVAQAFAAEGRNFARFHAEVQRLAALPKDERRATLARLSAAPASR